MIRLIWKLQNVCASIGHLCFMFMVLVVNHQATSAESVVLLCSLSERDLWGMLIADNLMHCKYFWH